MFVALTDNGKSEWRKSMGVFHARSQNWEKWLSVSSCLFVCPSVRMEQLGSHWTDFRSIWYLEDLSKIPRSNSRFIKIGQK
jgi:hypothetical protein